MACRLQQTTVGDVTGQLTSASMEQLRLETGSPGWLMDHNDEVFRVLATASWIQTPWNFASQFKI
jgi:hypothetical protein